MKELPTKYEYAGFTYAVIRNKDHTDFTLAPVFGQHQAAYKEKHLRAARECLIKDQETP